MFAILLGEMELFTVQLGIRLRLYAVLRDVNAITGALASRARIDECYAREWLEQQGARCLYIIERTNRR